MAPREPVWILPKVPQAAKSIQEAKVDQRVRATKMAPVAKTTAAQPAQARADQAQGAVELDRRAPAQDLERVAAQVPVRVAADGKAEYFS